MAKNKKISVQGVDIVLYEDNKEDYISLTDIARRKDAEHTVGAIKKGATSAKKNGPRLICCKRGRETLGILKFKYILICWPKITPWDPKMKVTP